MFTLLCGLYKYLFSPNEVVIALLGLDGAGKSTLMEQMNCISRHKSMTEKHIPSTIGLSIGQFIHQGTKWILWDLGGSEQMRPMWFNYTSSVDGLFYVIDGRNQERLMDSKMALFSLVSRLSKEKMVPLMIIVNKIDIGLIEEHTRIMETVSSWIIEIESMFDCPSIGRRFIIQTNVSAKEGVGVLEALEQFDSLLQQSPTND